MNDKVQLCIVIALVVAAAIFLIRYVYRQTRKGAKCDGCPISGHCNGKPRREKCPTGNNYPL